MYSLDYKAFLSSSYSTKSEINASLLIPSIPPHQDHQVPLIPLYRAFLSHLDQDLY